MTTTAADEITEPARVLVVEDEALIAHDICLMLDTLGYDVVGTSSSGPEALELALAERPDLVLMDIRIRGDWDGIQTAERIRAQVGSAILYVTAHADDSTVRRAQATEPLDFIGKPFSTSGLRSSVEKLLEAVRTERRLNQSPTASTPDLATLSI